MKHITRCTFLLALALSVDAPRATADDPYQPTWDSLSTNDLPEWVS